MRSSARNLLRESTLNLRSRGVMTAAVALTAFLFGGLAVTIPAFEVGATTAQHQEMIDRGYNVWRVQAAEPFSALQCDQLRTVSGVRDAGAALRETPMKVRELAGSGATVIEATPGYTRIVWPTSPRAVSVAIGEELSKSLGIRAGSVVNMQSVGRSNESATTQLHVASVLPKSSRIARANQAVVVAMPLSPHAPAVRECLVEAEMGARRSVEAYLVSVFTPGTTITPLFEDEGVGRSPHQQLRERISQWFPLAGGVAVAVIAVMAQFARRADWTLYRVLGVGFAGRILMLSMETALSILLPFSIGATAAITMAAPILEEPTVLRAAVEDLARAAMILLVIPPATMLVLRRRDPLAWLRGE